MNKTRRVTLDAISDHLEALPHLSAARGVVEAWQQGYHQGVQDERTSEANIGIAGFGAKVEPARINPYLAQQPAPQSAPVGVESEPGAVRALVTAANAVLALYPHDDQLWTLESAVRPFNATKPAECSDGCPPQQVCDYCQIAALAQQGGSDNDR